MGRLKLPHLGPGDPHGGCSFIYCSNREPSAGRWLLAHRNALKIVEALQTADFSCPDLPVSGSGTNRSCVGEATPGRKCSQLCKHGLYDRHDLPRHGQRRSPDALFSDPGRVERGRFAHQRRFYRRYDNSNVANTSESAICTRLPIISPPQNGPSAHFVFAW